MAPSHSPAVATSPSPVVDSYGRRLRYVRLSVTDRCNLSCTYCNPVQGCAIGKRDAMSWEDLDFLADVCVTDLGVEALRLTGGEPLVRPGLVEWIAGLRRLDGLRDISLTTNGILLAKMARELRDAGLTRVNVSLDTFDAERYRALTRGGSLERCREGIDAARALFDRVKVNCVALRPWVLEELDDFVRFSDATGVEVRFIELMPVFNEKDYFHTHFVSVEDLKSELERQGRTLEPEGHGAAEGNTTGYGPATTYRIAGTRARLGFISQMSNTKCLSCNKLRLTSDGALKPCLLMPEEVSLVPAIAARDRAAVASAMRWQFLARAERYDATTILESDVGRGMQATGG